MSPPLNVLDVLYSQNRQAKLSYQVEKKDFFVNSVINVANGAKMGKFEGLQACLLVIGRANDYFCGGWLNLQRCIENGSRISVV
jgi:hypothetical protein